MTGRDNMGYLLADIVKNCAKYFKTFTIVDTGSTDETAQLPVKVIDLRNWNDDWVKAYMTSISNVPIGDWFLFMDSDECPSPDLCKNIQAYVNEIDSKGFNSCGIRSNHHTYEWDGRLSHRTMGLTDWRKWVLLKKLSTITADTKGGHCMFIQNDRKHCDAPINYYYNHLKSNFSVCRSIFCHGFRFPNYMGDLDKGLDLINEFKAKTGFKTCSDFFSYLESDMISCFIFF
jgi:glycosyltransferase involved in cell wall biosynthesis